jgi:prophage antirepressor-like protein
MNELALTFEFEGYQARIILRDGEPWWVLADVCAVLEIANPRDVAARLDDDEKGVGNTDTPGGPQEMLIVSEPGLYKILQTSRKPEAKRFDRKVRHEVLPEIRRTGMYRGVLPTLDEMNALFNQSLVPLTRELADVKLVVSNVQKNVTFLTRRVDDIVPRRDFSKEARTQFRCVAQTKYDNDCPCCREVKLNETETHLDHFVGRELNGPEHGWIVCRRCNLRLRDDEFKNSRRHHFQVFQDYRRQMFAQGHDSNRRKGSRTVFQKKQGELFNK